MDGGYYRFSVTDNGPGIRPEDQARIFKPFEALPTSPLTSGADPRLGLGLGIAKNIVETAGGTMGLHSEWGHGATFWFNWPIPRARKTSDASTLERTPAQANSHE